MSAPSLHFVLVFTPEDQAWMRRNGLQPPRYWQDHSVAPVVGDVLRLGGRQFVIQARVWEQVDEQTQLRLFLGDAQATSDTTFG